MAGVNTTTTTETEFLITTTDVGHIDILPDSMEMTWLVWYTSAAFFMMVLFAFHSVKVYQDFFTDERKSLDHRSSKPKLTKEYKFAQYLTLFVLFNYMMCAILFSVEMFSYTWDLQACIDINNVGGWFMLLGKGCMYFLFMCRLHICYNKSAYGYSKRFIEVIGWGNVAFGLIFEGITTYMMAEYWQFFADVDEFPNPCYPIVTPGDWSIQYFGTTLMAWDFGMNVLALFLFINPLRKALAWRKATDEKTASNMTKSMLYIAIKYTVLTSVASISTSLIWITVNWILPNEYYVVCYDVVINSYCIMLMTAYYPDEVYYERSCFCCLFVCVPNKWRWKQMKNEKELRRANRRASETGGTTTATNAITVTPATTAITATPAQKELEVPPTVTED